MVNQLWKRAEGDLSLGPACSAPDQLVWEHSTRVAKLAVGIAGLAELAERAVDRLGLTAAALYHDAGWILQLRMGEEIPRDLLLRPTSEVQRELAAEWMATRLEGILPPRSLEAASRAIRFCDDRHTQLAEAQILAEAENLDEIGPQAVMIMLRRQLADGKTLADAVRVWQCQEEYHYWQARIKDGFRFEPVRRLAHRRWQALRRFMNDLGSVVRFEDLTLLQEPAALDELAVPPAEASSSSLQVA